MKKKKLKTQRSRRRREKLKQKAALRRTPTFSTRSVHRSNDPLSPNPRPSTLGPLFSSVSDPVHLFQFNDETVGEKLRQQAQALKRDKETRKGGSPQMLASWGARLSPTELQGRQWRPWRQCISLSFSLCKQRQNYTVFLVGTSFRRESNSYSQAYVSVVY